MALRPECHRVGGGSRWLLLLGIGFVAMSAVRGQTGSGMANTTHNLSVSGPGPIRALQETRICIFCHTPHNATPQSPLWNREIEPQVYSVYTSPTLQSGPLPQPTGPTKLCLGCHDGTIAMGAVLNPDGGIAMAGSDRLPPGSLADLGLDLSGHHPVSFPYSSALSNPELVDPPPEDLVYGGTDEVHCITCHDPHEDRFGKFLVKDNKFSALCTTCHRMNGWVGSAHATSNQSVAGVLPRPPRTWPTWTQLDEWGCEACHAPHFAATPEYLLHFTADPPEPFSCTTAGCHGAEPGPPHPAAPPAGRTPALLRSGSRAVVPNRTVDLSRQTRKLSGHREPAGGFALADRQPGGAGRSGIRTVACADCHNPHVMNGRDAEAPYASGLLESVPGVDRNGVAVDNATYEYEVCFRCHADDSPDLALVPRVVDQTNTRLDFDPDNPSYHPVVGPGRSGSAPSIPSSFLPTLSPTQSIYCTDCHADDEGGSRGPHGSSFPPILRERYETTDPTPESFDAYALCYRCHDRSSILRDDSFARKAFGARASGGGHSGHLAAGAPCSVCHDPHGVNDTPRGGAPTGTGSHTHLVNFDTRFVKPRGTSPFPVFQDTGERSGTCTLECHGFAHDATSYP